MSLDLIVKILGHVFMAFAGIAICVAIFFIVLLLTKIFVDNFLVF